jgi:hypothetical protein
MRPSTRERRTSAVVEAVGEAAAGQRRGEVRGGVKPVTAMDPLAAHRLRDHAEALLDVPAQDHLRGRKPALIRDATDHGIVEEPRCPSGLHASTAMRTRRVRRRCGSRGGSRSG